MVRKNYKRIEKSRKIRCESADSGVDTTLNNTAFRQVQASYTEFNGLEEEHLDFEPEFGDDELTDSTDKHSTFSQSTLKIANSDSREAHKDTQENGSISTVSIRSNGHRRSMLPVPRIDSKDGRQNEYLPFTYSTSSRTLLDSSSSEESCSSELNDNNIITETEDDLSKGQNFDDSGDIYNTEQDSDCNISQEEEDRLLDSSGDETDEPEVTIDRNEVDICQIGNSRITLPKFSDNFLQLEYKGNELKRTKPPIRFPLSQRKKKRRKWDLHFTPEVPPTFLFLNDIGYIPPCNQSDDSDSDDKGITQQYRKLYVICNEKDKFVCEKSEDELQRDMSFTNSDDSNFKLPLPPAPIGKRPPTRPKRTVSNFNESNTNLQIQVTNKRAEIGRRWSSDFSFPSSSFSSHKESTVDKDDTISLIASTIGDNVEDVTDDFSDVENSSMSLDTPERNELQKLPASPTNANYSKDLVESWIQSVPNPDPPTSTATRVNTVSEQPPYDGLTLMPPVSLAGPPRIHFKEVPSLFVGLCYHYYFNGHCVKMSNCNLPHNIVKDKFVMRFKKSSEEQLRKGYWHALKYDQLFKEVYPCFLLAFGSLKMYNDLTKSIKDLLQMTNINATEAVETVVEAFVDSGLTFLDAIERISFNVGFLQYPILADILLDLITRRPNISENWEVINRIAKARGHMSSDIARRILSRVTSVYPVDKKLCLDIYNVIVKNNMTDLTQISDDILAPFRALAGFRGLEEVPPKATLPAPIVRLTTNPSEREILAAHIDSNLNKERERFEREVAGLKVTTVFSQSPPATYFRSYDYSASKLSDNSSQAFDADDRYFIPNPKKEVGFQVKTAFGSRVSDSDRLSASGSTGSYDGMASSSNSLHFEPPELCEYVPDTVRRVDMRSEASSRTYSPLFEKSTVSQQSLTSEVTLTPAMPIFGNPHYKKDFKMNVSLHNLLPESREDVNINERDVAQLNYAIKSKNGAEFYRLLDYYKAPTTIRNFITMTIAHLKSCENGPYDLLMELIQALELEKPDYAKDVHIKIIFEVIVMNILFELERRGHWVRARRLLEHFCDWDSLISSQLLQIFPKRKLTHMGRYIFLAKIFAKGKNYHFTSEILQCPSLRLLEACDKWPYQCDPQLDMKNRNTILTEFFQDGYRYNIVDVSNMFRRVYKYEEISGYDPHTHFNPMLISIINSNSQQTLLLKHFYTDIDIYYKVMDKNVLRAFTVMLADHLSQEELFRLYDMCCDRQIYTYYNGGETTIILRTNMLNQELQLILSYYLEKLLKSGRQPKGDLLITIRLFDVKVFYPKILHMCVRSIQEINEKVKEILLNGYGIRVRDTATSKPTVVEVDQALLIDWLQRSQRRIHPFTTC